MWSHGIIMTMVSRHAGGRGLHR